MEDLELFPGYNLEESQALMNKVLVVLKHCTSLHHPDKQSNEERTINTKLLNEAAKLIGIKHIYHCRIILMFDLELNEDLADRILKIIAMNDPMIFEIIKAGIKKGNGVY